MIAKVLIQSLFGALLLGLLLFAPAGTMSWPEAWAYLLLFSVCSIAIAVWLLNADPALLAARMQSPLKAEQRPRDRAIVSLLLIFLAAWVVFIALDVQRFEWSDIPVWLEAVGAVLVVWSFWGFFTVLRVNSFAATTIGVQEERNQSVVSSGPYAVIRHPMYAYLFPLAIGTTLMLGSIWGLAGLLPMAIILAARALGEEAVLTEKLPGYRDYVGRVRYRLIPGVW